MTVDELIEELQKISDDGKGDKYVSAQCENCSVISSKVYTLFYDDILDEIIICER